MHLIYIVAITGMERGGGGEKEKRESGASGWIHTYIRRYNISTHACSMSTWYIPVPRNTEEGIYMKYTDLIEDKNGESQHLVVEQLSTVYSVLIRLLLCG